MRRSRHWLWLLLLIPIGLGLGRLRFDVEVLNLLPQRSPVVQGLKLYQENFANARELIVTVESPTAAVTEEAARRLAESWRSQPRLVRRVAWQPPWMEAPQQTAEFVAYLWLNEPSGGFSNVLRRLQDPVLGETLADARERLATSFSPRELAVLGYDPLGLTALPETAEQQAFGTGEALFASSNGTFRVMFVEAAPDLSGYKACLAWLQSMRAVETSLRESNRLPPEVAVRYTGRPAFVAEIAGGMERDMNASIAGTLIIICALFYLFHRRWKPLFWLIALLLFILGGTMALGGLIFGTLSVISLGFAAILLGLCVDYGLVLYQETRTHPGITAPALRRLLGPSILWSAVTTAAAFALLNLSSLPGLSQLGTLVALGVLVGGTVMLLAFLPPLLRGPWQAREPAGTVCEESHEDGVTERARPRAQRRQAAPSTLGLPGPRGHARAAGGTGPAWLFTSLMIVGAALLWWMKPPAFDHTAQALRPRHSPAYATVETIKEKLGRPQEPLWILVAGRDPAEVRARLLQTDQVLARARTEALIQSYTLPTRLWPDPDQQRENLRLFASLPIDRQRIRESFTARGFTDASRALTENFLATWRRAASGEGVFWPTNAASQWILGQTTARTPDRWLALGLIHTAEASPPNEAAWESLRMRLAEVGANLSGWELLGPSLFRIVQKELSRVLLPMSLMLVVCLGLAFRGVTGIALSLGTILVSACGLFLVMQAAGWTWNLMNLMALPLLLGVGVDYSIHIQLAMRRHRGDAAQVRRTTGRALLLCAATTATGFGSLGLSSNAGLAGLGQVCAAGLISCYVTAVYLLPAWWQATERREEKSTPLPNDTPT